MATVPAHLKGLSRVERRAYYARTTPESRSRLLERIKQSHLPEEQPVYKPGDFFIPEVDITKRQIRRGAEDQLGAGGIEGAPLGGDLGTRLRRITEDYELGNLDIGRREGEAGEDYGTTTAGINRNFQRLGVAQNDAGRAAGLRGGFQIASQAARTENQGIQQAGVDTNYKRLLEGLTRARGELATSFTRGGSDINTEAARIRREANIGFGDLDLQEADAAVKAGYVPPTTPRPPRITSYPRRRRRRR